MSNHIGRLIECARMGIRFHCDPEQVKEMAAECESALADQRRYRFLRELPAGYEDTDWLWGNQGDALDTVLDQAISEPKS